MFDLGGGELLVIGIVALVVIGPKELPGLLRTIGQAIGKLRRMAGDFQGQFNDAMKEADLGETQKILTDIHSTVRSKFDIGKMTDMAEVTSSINSSSATTSAMSNDHVPSAVESSLATEVVADITPSIPLILAEETALVEPEKKKTSRKKKPTHLYHYLNLDRTHQV